MIESISPTHFSTFVDALKNQSPKKSSKHNSNSPFKSISPKLIRSIKSGQLSPKKSPSLKSIAASRSPKAIKSKVASVSVKPILTISRNSPKPLKSSDSVKVIKSLHKNNITKSPDKNMKKYEKDAYIARGFQGAVYTVKNHDDKVIKVTKINNIRKLNNTLEEIKFAKLASKLKIGPTIFNTDYVYDDNKNIVQIEMTMSKASMINKKKNEVSTKDKQSICSLFKKLYIYSKSGNGFLPVDFLFGVLKENKWIIIDYGVVVSVNNKDKFIDALEEYLDCLDFNEPYMLNESLKYYVKNYNDAFSKDLQRIVKA